MTEWTIAEIVETAAGYLRDKGSSSPRLDAELLLAEALGMDRIHLYALHDRPLAICEVDHYRELIGRRGRHEPVAYIIGHGYFRHLPARADPGRPDPAARDGGVGGRCHRLAQSAAAVGGRPKGRR